MDTGTALKRKAGRYATIALVLLLLTSPVAGFIAGYISFFGPVTTYIWGGINGKIRCKILCNNNFS